jgi:hypothetical protein
MKTDEFAKLLATGAGPAASGAPARRFAAAMVIGAALSLLIMAGVLGVRATLADDMGLPMFWTKFAFPAWLAAGAAVAALRLGRPGVRLAGVPAALAIPVVALWLVAGVVLASADASQRPALLLGETWRSCPFNITLLSLPMLAASLWAMKAYAPTRLGWSGAAAGLLAGAGGALVYAFHCPELAAPFLAVWYVLGMAIPTAVGAVAGPRILRW